MSNIYRLNTKIRLTMLCLSCFELYSHWVPLGSLLCSERFFCGYSGFLSSPQKPTFYLISGSSASKTLFIFLLIYLLRNQSTVLCLAIILFLRSVIFLFITELQTTSWIAKNKVKVSFVLLVEGTVGPGSDTKET